MLLLPQTRQIAALDHNGRNINMTRRMTGCYKCHLQVGGKGTNLCERCQIALEHLQLANRHSRREAFSTANHTSL
jgi:hypothetical protein